MNTFPLAMDTTVPYHNSWIAGTFGADVRDCDTFGNFGPYRLDDPVLFATPNAAWMIRASCGHTGSFGDGCAGAGGREPLELVPNNQPAIGTDWELDMFNVPPDTGNCGVILGLSPGVNVDFTPAGAPGCTLYVDVLSFYPCSSNGNPARTLVPVPNSPALMGAHALAQGLVASPASNALGVLFSNGLDFYVGG